MKSQNLIGIFLLMIVFISISTTCKKNNSFLPVTLDEPEFISTDIDLFWEVFDSNDFSIENFQNEYINKGTIGLQNYALQKNLAQALMQKLLSQHYIDYYNSVRNTTLEISEAIKKSETAFRRLKDIHENTIFLNTYFLVGAATAGGRVSENGLLIAVEMFSNNDSIDLSNLSEWHQNVIRNNEYLASIVVHEFIHSQQFNLRNNGSVLEASLAEGMADFLSHYLLEDEPFMNEPLHTYGNPREEELWLEFKDEMYLDHSETEWLYTASITKNGHPADMGYYVGYKIYESFSSSFDIKEDAIRAILTTDYRKVLKASGYADKFE